MSPDPIDDLTTYSLPISEEIIGDLQNKAKILPKLITDGTLRSTLIAMPVYELSAIIEVNDFRVIERLFQIYVHFANVFVWCDQEDPANYLPASVAVPLVALSKMVERPPILPYASTALANYVRIDPEGGIRVENLRCIQKVVDIPDETWFHMIHVEIENHAGKAIEACVQAGEHVCNDDLDRVEQSLTQVPDILVQMIQTFRRITEKCSTDKYYFTLRPYLFGFDNIVYQGVKEFGEKPQSFRGQTGAQSSALPALKDLLGLKHQEGGLSEHLKIMRHHMPKPHRDFLTSIDTGLVREFVLRRQSQSLTEIYNTCLEKMVSFRSLHLRQAHAFVASKVENPIGTGGTDFMHWLKLLRDETEEQLIRTK